MDKTKRIHFIGIGGIGISALARFLKEQGYEVSGSDLNGSEVLKELQDEGMRVSVGHDAKAIKGAGMVIYSAAIKPDNVELQAALKQGIPTLSRKEALPLILHKKKVISVAGAHGKSTTSSILAALLDSSFIIGAVDKKSGKNMQYKRSEYLVFEADESDSSFLNFPSHMAVVTNTEPEHMEHYGNNLDNFYGAYKSFLDKAKYRVLNNSDDFLKNYEKRSTRLKLEDIKNIEFRIKDYKPLISFELKDLGHFSLQGHGDFMAQNAALAVLAALKLGVDLKSIKERLLNYQGIKKRFDLLKRSESFVLIDDYGHHPTEITCTAKGIFTYAKALHMDEKIAIWQPHKYSRLAYNIEGFKRCFDGFDTLVIMPVYAAGESLVELHLDKLFPKAVFAKDIKALSNSLELFLENDEKMTIDKGLAVAFNAGDLSSKLRTCLDY